MTVVSAGLVGICNYFSRRELALTLERGDFGLLYSAIGIFTITVAIADFGLNNTLTMRLSRYSSEGSYPECRRIFVNVLLFKVLLAVLLTTGALTAADWICTDYFRYPGGTRIFRIGAVYCISYQFLLFFVAVFCGLKAFVSMNLAQLSFYLPSAVLLMAVPGGTLLRVGMFIFGGLVLFPVAYALLRRRAEINSSGEPHDGVGWGQLLAVSKWFMMGNVFLTMLGFADIVIIGRLAGVASAGVYNAAVAVGMIVTPLTLAANLSLTVIAEHWKKGDVVGITDLVNCAINVWSALFLCGGLFFLLFAEEVITILFSSDFVAAAPALAVLGPAVLLNVLLLFLYGVLNGMDQFLTANSILVVGVVIDILCGAILVPGWGIIGGAAGTLAGYGVSALLCYAILSRRLSGIKLSLFPLSVGVFVYIGGWLCRHASLGIRCGVLALTVLFLGGWVKSVLTALWGVTGGNCEKQLKPGQEDDAV